MKSILGPTGRNIIRSLSFTRTLFAFDFDGTLAPIVSIPENARMRKTTQKLIEQLNERDDVAVISGRSIKDLSQRIGFSPRYMIGNHGLEGLPKSKFNLDDAKVTSTHWMHVLEKELPEDPGLSIEFKQYSLAVHYRHCKNKKKMRTAITDQIQHLKPEARVIPGKSVVNLIPKEAPHKGFALQSLMKQGKYDYAVFIGDDDTDEDVFSLMDDGILSIRVGKKLKSHAQYYLYDQTEINRLLALILENKP